jgi:hypothetical protein
VSTLTPTPSEVVYGYDSTHGGVYDCGRCGERHAGIGSLFDAFEEARGHAGQLAHDGVTTREAS